MDTERHCDRFNLKADVFTYYLSIQCSAHGERSLHSTPCRRLQTGKLARPGKGTGIEGRGASAVHHSTHIVVAPMFLLHVVVAAVTYDLTEISYTSITPKTNKFHVHASPDFIHSHFIHISNMASIARPDTSRLDSFQKAPHRDFHPRERTVFSDVSPSLAN